MVAKSLNLDDAEIEESKRDLITREIGKFREVMKVIIFTLTLIFFFLCHSYFSALLFGHIVGCDIYQNLRRYYKLWADRIGYRVCKNIGLQMIIILKLLSSIM